VQKLSGRVSRRTLAPKVFAEPVSLSSTVPAGFRLPPTATGSGFDLLTLRARRKGKVTVGRVPVQEVENRRVRYLRIIQLSTIPQPFFQLVGKPVDGLDAGLYAVGSFAA
jgi:hypothetical protein